MCNIASYIQRIVLPQTILKRICVSEKKSFQLLFISFVFQYVIMMQKIVFSPIFENKSDKTVTLFLHFELHDLLLN